MSATLGILEDLSPGFYCTLVQSGAIVQFFVVHVNAHVTHVDTAM